MSVRPKIGIVGSGSWATAIVKILCEQDIEIHWWVRRDSAREHILQFGHHPDYISAARLDCAKIKLHADVRSVLVSAETIVFATPSAFLKQALEGVSEAELNDKTIVSAIKGMIPGDKENYIIAEYFEQFWKVSNDRFVVISGPCHAEEVAQEKLSYLTFSSPNMALAETVSSLFACRFIRVSVTDDIFGTEIAAVMKNIIAVASGICHGLGYGDNFQAVLVSNAIQEIKRFVDAVHPIERDIKGSAYLGDLLVTAYSNFSRNRTFGMMIGKGYSVKAAQLEMNMVAEGYYSVRNIFENNSKYGVDLPITEAVYNILYKGFRPAEAIQKMSSFLR